MPKINFNVTFVNEVGEPIQRVKFEIKKIKVGEDGQAAPKPVVDEEGFAVHENVPVKELLVQILQMPYPDDKDQSFEERAKRGKLAQKIANNNSASYNENDIALIEEYAKRNASTPLLAQLSDLLLGERGDGEQAA
jgi:hypothetical protein